MSGSLEEQEIEVKHEQAGRVFPSLRPRPQKTNLRSAKRRR